MLQQTSNDARVTAINWARQASIDPGTVYLDTETTGLDRRAEIVDIAVVSADGRVLLDTLVKPSRSIPAEVIRIHGITDQMVANAPGWPDVARRLGAILDAASRVVVYNASFDRRIIDQCNFRHDIAGTRSRWQCAMEQYASFAGTSGRRGGYRWHKLIDAAASFGHREAVQHRALTDTRLCRAVVRSMATA